MTPASTLQHSAFYKFTDVTDVPALVSLLHDETQDLLGSILVAPEGINGMVAGTVAALEAFESTLAAIPAFSDMAFKRSACTTVPFRRMKVRRRKEIVPFGITNVDAKAGTVAATQVLPADWRTLIEQEDVVLIDNRNSFEYRLGRFRNAIDPGVAHFRDFPQYITDNLEAWKADGKRIAMYCTGGIRCEKTVAWMSAFNIPVYQLHGGILNYFAALPDAERDWEGECFVFDNRIALDTKLRETGTTLEAVYQGDSDAEWRLRRARELQGDHD
jgi:UPF0176 protein